MQITSASPLHSSPKSDVPVGPGAAPDAAGIDAVDAGHTSNAGGSPALAFGRILAQRMDPGSVTDRPVSTGGPHAAVPGQGVATTPRTATGPAIDGTPWVAKDGTPAPAAASPDDVEAIVVAPGNSPAPSARTTKADATLAVDGSPLDPQAKDGEDAVGNDLAAQLALVSQWAALALPATPQQAAPQADSGNGRLDVKGKLEALRAASATGGTPLASTAEQSPAGGIEAEAPAAASSRFARALSPMRESGARANVPTSSTGTKATPATGGEARASSVDLPAHKLDAILGPDRAEPAAVPTIEANLHGKPTASAASMDGIAAPGVQPAPSQAVVSANLPSSPTVAPTVAPTVHLREPVGTPAWSHEVGQATLRIAASALQSATLSLNPEHLGPVDVQLRIDNGIASIAFNAAHVETRHALEASRPTLDQMFTDQGIKLGDCAVGDFGSSARHSEADASQANASSRESAARRRDADHVAGEAVRVSTLTTRLRALGLVDTFA